MEIVYRPIGVIHTPFQNLEGMPIQPAGAAGVRGTIEVFPGYEKGLLDLDGFSHIILLYHFHRSKGFEMEVMPFLDVIRHGVFATRAPRRPNAIGLSVVRLTQIVETRILQVENVDMVDGTPLLDIKPYAAAFDHHETDSSGWLQKAAECSKNKKSDSRFDIK